MDASTSPNRWGSLALYLALIAAWTAMLGSLYFSEVRGFVPCELCWYQRILMYPLAGVIALGILRWDAQLPYLVLPFSLLGQGVSTYHYLLQKTTLFGESVSCSVGVPCTTVWINWLGFITIPFLAMTAFLIITLAMLVAYYSDAPDPGTGTPVRWPVAPILAAALLAYASVALQPQPASQATLKLDPVPGTESAAFMPVEPAGGGQTLAEGERIYREACAACHGPDGQGIPTLGNTLAASEFLDSHRDAEVLAMIRAGRDPTDPENRSGVAMPPSGGRPDLTDDELLAVIRYLRQGLVQQ